MVDVCEVSCLAQKACPDFMDLDQVSREQSVKRPICQ